MLFLLFTLTVVCSTVEVSTKFVLDRFLYENPFCATVKQCAKENDGCNGQVMTVNSGHIQLNNYPSRFSCRWEIKGTSKTKIRLKIEQGVDSFGIENQPMCGFDRLHIQSATGNKYGRLCSSKANSGEIFNGMLDSETAGGVKIPSSEWQQDNGILLDTNHLVVAFDSDQEKTGAGFKIVFEIEGAAKTEMEQTVNEAKDGLQTLADHYVDPAADPKKAERIRKRMENLFRKFISRMDKCGSLDKKSAGIDPEVFATLDLDMAEEAWNAFLKDSFEDCSHAIFIIRDNDGYDNTNWPNRLESYFSMIKKGAESIKRKIERKQEREARG